MSRPFQHPALTSDIRAALNLPRDADPAARAKANPAMQWVTDHHAEKHIFQALALTTTPKPIADASGRPSMWLCPPPGGMGNHVGILITADPQGNIRCVASNLITQPIQDSKATLPDTTPDAISALRSKDDTQRLIQQAVNAACMANMDQVQKLCAESQRFKTTALFLVVVTDGPPLVFMTTLVIQGPRQPNPKLIFTGKVLP
ncbi:hypothetical protein [Rhodoferax sp.]|uniref:hypothetical protein n=1 Tax=Rhodoferax sp. TaxID=50421 RepID=UPI0025F63BA0|nr:hypothetical protein [Rhodoferax sp.]MCM2340860.1 hypothetical protein [Rhodoferax sp.]